MSITQNKVQYIFPRIGIVNLQTITNTASLLTQIQAYHGKYYQIFNLTNAAIFTSEKAKQIETKFKWRSLPFSITEAVRILAKLEQCLRLNKGNVVVFCVSNTDSETFVKVIVREFFRVCMLDIPGYQKSIKLSNNTQRKVESILSELTYPLFSQSLQSLLTNHQINSPPVKTICSLQISSSSFIPLFEIWQQSRYNDFQLAYTHQICNQLVPYYFNLNKPLQVDKKSIGRKHYDNKPQRKYLSRPVVVCGDVKVIVYSFNTLQKTKQFTFGFNTKQLQFTQQLGDNEGILTFTYDDLYIDNPQSYKQPNNNRSSLLIDQSIQVYVKVQNWCTQQQQCIYVSGCEQCQQHCKRLNLRYNETQTQLNVRNFIAKGRQSKFSKSSLYYDSQINALKGLLDENKDEDKGLNPQQIFSIIKNNIMDECQNQIRLTQHNLQNCKQSTNNFNQFNCPLVKLFLQNMSIFQIPRTQGFHTFNKQKHQRIYVFSRKKHNPLSTPHEKSHLFKIYHITQTGSGLRYEESANKERCLREQLYPSGHDNSDKDAQRFDLQYKKQPILESIGEKRKWIKQKLSLHFQTSTLKPNKIAKPPRLQSFRQTKAITSKSLLSKMKSLDQYSISSPVSLSIDAKYKKVSLADLDKLGGTEQVQCQARYFRKDKKKVRSQCRQKASPPALSLSRQMEFIKTGVVNGLSIVSRRHRQHQQTIPDKVNAYNPYLLSPIDHTRSKSLQHQPPSSLDKSYDTTTIDDCNNFSLYIRKRNSVNLEVDPDQRVSRKNILQLRRRRSLEANSMKVTQINKESLIKIQKTTSKNQTKYLPKI